MDVITLAVPSVGEVNLTKDSAPAPISLFLHGSFGACSPWDYCPIGVDVISEDMTELSSGHVHQIEEILADHQTLLDRASSFANARLDDIEPVALFLPEFLFWPIEDSTEPISWGINFQQGQSGSAYSDGVIIYFTGTTPIDVSDTTDDEPLYPEEN